MAISVILYASPPIFEGAKKLKKDAIQWLTNSFVNGSFNPSASRSSFHRNELKHIFPTHMQKKKTSGRTRSSKRCALTAPSSILL
jgi:hypothetical protein